MFILDFLFRYGPQMWAWAKKEIDELDKKPTFSNEEKATEFRTAAISKFGISADKAKKFHEWSMQRVRGKQWTCVAAAEVGLDKYYA